ALGRVETRQELEHPPEDAVGAPFKAPVVEDEPEGPVGAESDETLDAPAENLDGFIRADFFQAAVSEHGDQDMAGDGPVPGCRENLRAGGHRIGDDIGLILEPVVADLDTVLRARARLGAAPDAIFDIDDVFPDS